jgi:hypothetical protein
LYNVVPSASEAACPAVAPVITTAIAASDIRIRVIVFFTGFPPYPLQIKIPQVANPKIANSRVIDVTSSRYVNLSIFINY